jgi:nitroimidazol reductase NimA-like FMN-containing flavoprotein (pyridoxamine 5'-phosphate oxidase superfamily)
MGEDQLWEFVRDAHTGILTTLRADGSPIALPTWFACLDRTVYVATRGKKVDRIRSNPVSSFLVEDGERWGELRAVHLSGLSEVVSLEGGLAKAFGAEMARKYDSHRTPIADLPDRARRAYATGAVVRFTPAGKILNWDNRLSGAR